MTYGSSSEQRAASSEQRAASSEQRAASSGEQRRAAESGELCSGRTQHELRRTANVRYLYQSVELQAGIAAAAQLSVQCGSSRRRGTSGARATTDVCRESRTWCEPELELKPRLEAKPTTLRPHRQLSVAPATTYSQCRPGAARAVRMTRSRSARVTNSQLGSHRAGCCGGCAGSAAALEALWRYNLTV